MNNEIKKDWRDGLLDPDFHCKLFSKADPSKDWDMYRQVDFSRFSLDPAYEQPCSSGEMIDIYNRGFRAAWHLRDHRPAPSPWINVENRLPYEWEGRFIPTVNTDGEVWVAKWEMDEWWYANEKSAHIVKWQPLPSAEDPAPPATADIEQIADAHCPLPDPKSKDDQMNAGLIYSERTGFIKGYLAAFGIKKSELK